ncbi:MAG: cystathionine gamma-synthase family protein [Phycisphaerales bacterium]|nr:cystathionine gamma-synthase family protein [Planctomycetota bacterium]MCH8508906.1 cystathionine gamma-synthase family protein [Phycisphaerales bacterium]
MTEPNHLRQATRCVWGGRTEPDPHGATVAPVYHGVTFNYDDLDEWQAVGSGERPGHIYSRNTNPTVEIFERVMRDLDGAEASTSFATGMAAISNTLFTFLSPGSRVVSIKDSYGGTNKLFVEFLPRFGVEVVLCETHDHEQIEREAAKGCDVLYLETPTNPTLKVLDIRRLAEAGRRGGATVVVDNTFATPINQRPLELGAHLVLHSATKFLGGHSDAMGGIVSGDAERIRSLYHFREINGASLDPMSAYLLTRGLRTLELRVSRQNESAQAIAEWLAAQPQVEAVYYPGLAGHPNHAVAKAQMSGFGGVVSFSLAGGMPALRAVVPALRLAHRAASLGSVGTLAGPPAMTSHVELSAHERAAAGIPESLVRYSVGIEDPADLIADLEAAFAHIPQNIPA